MKQSYFLTLFLLCTAAICYGQMPTIYVSPGGNDNQPGSDPSAPKGTISAAFETLINAKESPTDTGRLVLLPGTYHMDQTLLIDEEFGPLSIEAQVEGQTILKGSRLIEGTWKKYKGNTWKIKIDTPITPFSQIYLNGAQQILARYPNYDSTASRYNGYAADAIDPERILTWKHPKGAIVHAMHSGEWGGFHYMIESVNRKGEVELIGGHQNNRPSPMHKEYRMVENVFEELDAPGEWYFDADASTLFLWPMDGNDPSGSKVEVSVLNNLIEIRGKSSDEPASGITIKGITFQHTNRTFMEEYEPLLRSDWMIHRGAAILIEHAERVRIEGCELSQLGGNALFMSAYNRNHQITGNHIFDCGASAVSAVGLSSAVRSPSFTYREFVDFDELDTLPGPKTQDYPASCVIDNNLIHDIGTVEKQVAGVQISMAMDITVSHNSIYNLPRSGINVSEGTWGGHIIEFNDVFNTVRETSDHGAFNSWGRDRFWHPNRKTMDKIMADNPDMPYWDAIHTTIIRNNRMRCDHGWDIDLDDGSSNYHLYNNLCLNGGIKLREGFYRTVENNIMVNNGFHPHVWFKNSGDVFRRNIVMTKHQDIRLQDWGDEIDYNLFPDEQALEAAQENGVDANSSSGDPQFNDPRNGDFSVPTSSPAVALGFVNFTMDDFGVQDPRMKQLAATPEIPELILTLAASEGQSTHEWLGADLKNIETMAERSSAGLNETSGVLVQRITTGSQSSKGGLQAGDVVIKCQGGKISTIQDLLSCYQGHNWTGQLNLVIVRNQQKQKLTFKTK